MADSLLFLRCFSLDTKDDQQENKPVIPPSGHLCHRSNSAMSAADTP